MALLEALARRGPIVIFEEIKYVTEKKEFLFQKEILKISEK